jgi:hypothetical protein
MTTQIFTGTLVVHTCGGCGTVYGIEKSTWDRVQADDGLSIRCTNHKCPWPSAHFPESELARTKRALEHAQRCSQGNREEADRERARKEAAQRQASALRGVITKTKRRVHHGVCPVEGCRRTFQNLRDHVRNQHPDYTAP